MMEFWEFCFLWGILYFVDFTLVLWPILSLNFVYEVNYRIAYSIAYSLFERWIYFCTIILEPFAGGTGLSPLSNMSWLYICIISINIDIWVYFWMLCSVPLFFFFLVYLYTTTTLYFFFFLYFSVLFTILYEITWTQVNLVLCLSYFGYSKSYAGTLICAISRVPVGGSFASLCVHWLCPSWRKWKWIHLEEYSPGGLYTFPSGRQMVAVSSPLHVSTQRVVPQSSPQLAVYGKRSWASSPVCRPKPISPL